MRNNSLNRRIIPVHRSGLPDATRTPPAYFVQVHLLAVESSLSGDPSTRSEGLQLPQNGEERAVGGPLLLERVRPFAMSIGHGCARE